MIGFRELSCYGPSNFLIFLIAWRSGDQDELGERGLETLCIFDFGTKFFLSYCGLKLLLTLNAYEAIDASISVTVNINAMLLLTGTPILLSVRIVQYAREKHTRVTFEVLPIFGLGK